MPKSWFDDLGWWKQNEAYETFLSYRELDNKQTYEECVLATIPIIRVVASSSSVKLVADADSDDLISAAIETILKALPKMRVKPIENLNTPGKYMRYLYTCVTNAFYKELTSLYGKDHRVKQALQDKQKLYPLAVASHAKVTPQVFLAELPQRLLDISEKNIRFMDADKVACVYALEQKLNDREISSRVLKLLGTDIPRKFLSKYCSYLVQDALEVLKMEEQMNEYVDPEFVPFCTIDELTEVS